MQQFEREIDANEAQRMADVNLVELRDEVFRSESSQMSLFALTVDEILQSHGVTPAKMESWHRAGILTLDPTSASPLGPGEQAEVEFLATLAASGQTIESAHVILEGLDAPYRYSVSALVYDFSSRRWLSRQEPEAAEAIHFAAELANEESGPELLVEMGRAALDRLAARVAPKGDDV